MLSNSSNIFTKKTAIFIFAAVFFVIADRLLEALSLNGRFDRPIPLVGNFFSLEYIKNYYIAFSIPFSGPILTGLIGLIILVLLYYWLRELSIRRLGSQISNYTYALTILIVGAILNFTDRLEHGFVIDYFYLKFFTVFNLADVMIVLAVLYMIFNLRRK